MRNTIIFFTISLSLISTPPNLVFAENIDPMLAGCRYAYQENTGWLNLEPGGNGSDGVTVYSDHLQGYIWAENIGWINLSPELYGGVTNDGEGNLGGYAWSENTGWINFAPNYGGVNIDIFTGKISGWGWGENIGWINFDLVSQVTCQARTEWSIWEEDGDPVHNWDSDPDTDGMVNLTDPDSDNDTIDNAIEYAMWGEDWNQDLDGDGLYNLIDDDADGDGIIDGEDPYPGRIGAILCPGILLLLL